VVARRCWTKVLKYAVRNGRWKHACGHSGGLAPNSAYRCWHVPEHLRCRSSNCRSTLQRNKKNVYVYQIKLCREHRNVSCKTAPKISPLSLLNSNCRDAMTLPYSHHSEASFAMLPVPFCLSTQSHPRNRISSSPVHLSSRSW
jgi:hypothetical protein